MPTFLVSYRMRGNVVIISREGEDDWAMNEESLRQAIKNVEKSRKDYVTQEAYDRNHALYTDALAYLLANRK